VWAVGVMAAFVPEPALAGGEDLLEAVVGIVAMAKSKVTTYLQL